MALPDPDGAQREPLLRDLELAISRAEASLRDEAESGDPVQVAELRREFERAGSLLEELRRRR